MNPQDIDDDNFSQYDTSGTVNSACSIGLWGIPPQQSQNKNSSNQEKGTAWGAMKRQKEKLIRKVGPYPR